jgi:hypothetical protein
MSDSLPQRINFKFGKEFIAIIEDFIVIWGPLSPPITSNAMVRLFKGIP